MAPLHYYERVTVAFWSRSHTELARRPGETMLADAAVHAVLAGLRRYTEPPALLTGYEADAAADFVLIRSLLPDSSADMLWRVRAAAFYLRWLELNRGAA